MGKNIFTLTSGHIEILTQFFSHTVVCSGFDADCVLSHTVVLIYKQRVKYQVDFQEKQNKNVS